MADEHHGPRNITGIFVAIGATLALVPLLLATREQPSPGRNRSARPPPLPEIAPPSPPPEHGSRLGDPDGDAELRALFDADQNERLEIRARPRSTEADGALARSDVRRRARLAEILAAGRVRTGVDWFEAALLEQHGQSLEDFERARAYAVRSVLQGDEDGLRLAAAAWDRWLLHAGYPQRFGTQGRCALEAGVRRCHLDVYDPSTTDEERARWNVPPLAVLLRQFDAHDSAPITK